MDTLPNLFQLPSLSPVVWITLGIGNLFDSLHPNRHSDGYHEST